MAQTESLRHGRRPARNEGTNHAASALAVHEADEEAAYSAFAEEFGAVREHIVDSPEGSLTRDAREWKAALRELVEDVEAAAVRASRG